RRQIGRRARPPGTRCRMGWPGRPPPADRRARPRVACFATGPAVGSGLPACGDSMARGQVSRPILGFPESSLLSGCCSWDRCTGQMMGRFRRSADTLLSGVTRARGAPGLRLVALWIFGCLALAIVTWVCFLLDLDPGAVGFA